MRFARFLVIPGILLSLSSCGLVKGLEDEIRIVFEYNNEIIFEDTATQFKNAVMPTLSEEQIPLNHEFYGWTWLDPDSVDVTASDFDSKYLEKDGIVHYYDVINYSFNDCVTLRPVFINIDDIPIPNYYVAIGWYNRPGTSGLTQESVSNWTNDLYTFLRSNGATDEDIANVKITPYEGNVATAGANINKDRFNDILIGFGGNLDDEDGANVKVIEHIGGITMGGQSRYISRLTDKEIAIDVFEWLQTPEGTNALK